MPHFARLLVIFAVWLALVVSVGPGFTRCLAQLQPMFPVPSPTIELGAPGELWSVLQTHKAYKLNAVTGTILDSVDFGIPPENDGRGVAWDGTHLWYSEWDFDKIYRLNPITGGVVQEYTSPGSGPQGLAWDGTHLWHTDEYTDLLYKIDPATGTVVSTLPSPEPSTWFVGIAYNDGFLYLYSFLTQTIYRVRATDGLLMGTYALSQTEAGGDITADDTYLYVVADGMVVTRIPYTVFPPVLAVVPSPTIELGAPGELWSVLATHKAYKLNVATGAILDSVSFAIPPENDGRGVAWDGTHLWYAEWDFDKIYKLNPVDGSIVQEYNSPGSGPQGLAWDGTHLWHTDEYTDLIYKINPATGMVVSTIPSPAPSTWFVGIAHNDGFLYLYSFLTQTIYRVRASDGLLMSTYALSQTEAGGDITADDTYLYIVADGMVVTRIPYTVFPALFARVSVSDGWNMLSVPLTVSDARRTELFPTSSSAAFAFDPIGGYSHRDSLLPGIGYWLKFDSAETVTLTGGHRPVDSLDVVAGWNLVGSISIPVPAATAIPWPDSILQSSFYGYDGGYFVADSILPGQAYWVKAASAGTLILGTGLPLRELTRGVASVESLQELPWLEVHDASGRSSRVFTARLGELDPASYDLPPLPPPGVFDVRLASGSVVAVDEQLVLVSGVTYPLRLTGDGVSVVVNGHPVRAEDLKGGVLVEGPTEVRIRSLSGMTTPREFALHQNYPNPFNPSTTIGVAVPVESRVRMRLYDLLGRQVVQLMDETRPAGVTQVHWDASLAASGVYFVQVEAAPVAGGVAYTGMRKMLLLR